jgi:polyhydroxybutyrate depolymerase
VSWKGCAAPVVLYRIEGGGHTWPGATVDVDRLGMTTHQVRATDAMWEFFARNT